MAFCYNWDKMIADYCHAKRVRICAEKEASKLLVENNALQNEIAQLKEERDHAVACFKQATSPAESCQEERKKGSGGCGTCAICCKELKIENELLRALIKNLL